MKKAVMYGAGNIGRGFVGMLFSQSGYEVVFVDINPVVIDRMNEEHRYPVRIVGEEKYREEIVENVRAVNASNKDIVAEEIAGADIMATAVGVGVLPRIAAPIALGLRKRWERGNFNPLNIIICENLLGADGFLRKLIKQELDGQEAAYFDEKVGLVEASIGRMVPVMTPEMQEGNPLRVWVEPYCELPVDKAGFKGEIPQIKNMVPFEPFDFYIQRKLFMHNMGHAATAYLGFLDGKTYIWEAVRNPFIKLAVLRALQESAVAMSQEHGAELKNLLEHAEDLLYRFGNRLLGDTVERVGRDPIRKLSSNDRLTGAAKLCAKQGILPVYISLGIAAGFLFAPAGDEAAADIREFIGCKGIEAAIREFCGLDGTDGISRNVRGFYGMFEKGSSLQEVLEKAEKIKRGHEWVIS